MQKIGDIYKKYNIMPNLQEHQIRVSAVVWQICDSLDIEVNKDLIIRASLLHDMGNIVKFNLNYFPEFLEPEGLGYWKKIKDEYIAKYGKDAHKATAKIIKEILKSENIVQLALKIRFSLLCEHAKLNDINIKLIHYADMRVGPNGVVSYEDRMEDGYKRYKDSPNFGIKNRRKKLIACGKEIEKYIFTHSNLKPEDVNDESVKLYLEKLKNFTI